MNLEYWENYFLKESEKDPGYEAIPKVLQYESIDEYMESLGFATGQDIPLNHLIDYDYGSWLFLDALAKAEEMVAVDDALDRLLQKGLIEAFYDEEKNDLIYRVVE